MKKSKFLLFFLLIIFNTIAQSIKAQMHWLDVPIEKGIVKGNFTITIVDNGAIIKPDEEFTLSSLGLLASSHPDLSSTYTDSYLQDYYKHELRSKNPKNDAYCFYQVTIAVDNDPTVYYGLMCFYKTRKSHKDDAVCQYYEIKIPNNYFEKARGGNLSNAYEFWRSGSQKDGQEVMTWVIAFSDSKDLVWGGI